MAVAERSDTSPVRVARDSDVVTSPELRSGPTVIVDDVHITYRVIKGQRPTLRRLISRRFKPQPYTPVRAVRGVDFVAYAGEAIGVIGRNGSGKSTLLRGIAGLLPVTKGAIYVRKTPVLLGVGAALQQELSGRRNVYLAGTALGLSRAEIDERFDEIVDFAGVRDFIDMPMRAYSSGMGARLQFAISTAVTPDLLLVDETLATGDAEFKRKSEKRIMEMLEEAGTVILVSHSLGIVRQICSRVVWLDEGKVRLDGDPDEVVDAYVEATS